MPDVNGRLRCRIDRRAAGVTVALAVATGVSATPAAANPVDPYVDQYGTQICQGLTRNSSHAEVVKAIRALQNYVHLSDEDAKYVVVESVSRLCPQYVDLLYASDS